VLFLVAIAAAWGVLEPVLQKRERTRKSNALRARARDEAEHTSSRVTPPRLSNGPSTELL